MMFSRMFRLHATRTKSHSSGYHGSTRFGGDGGGGSVLFGPFWPEVHVLSVISLNGLRIKVFWAEINGLQD